MKDNKDLDSLTKRYEFEYKKDYQDDWDIHKDYIQTFDDYEDMLVGNVTDSVSQSVQGARITDSYATTLAIERSARVMGKLPEGIVEAAAKSDAGKGAFMDILRQKWIYPNANSQHDFLTKLRLWQLYSSVYGYMPMFYDWNVAPSGYIGPDCWLWNPRMFVPQQGRTSLNDMEYVTALTYVNRSYLEGVLDEESDDEKKSDDGWDRDAIETLLEVVDEQEDSDQHKDTRIERSRVGQPTKRGILLATRYEAGEDGEWITFAPDHAYVEVRRIKNPHKNGKIPFVIKYSQPLFDSFYGLGDFQRAKPLQFARDGLTNYYFKGIKMNLIPPLVINANGVLKHTVDYREGGIMEETIDGSIRRLETSTAGLQTYQAAQSNLTGSLLSQYGTQNASIPGAESLNPSQGKTPAAIRMYNEKEATRDGQERQQMEAAIERLTDGFFSLVANIGTEDVPVNLLSGDIKAIIDAGLEDVVDLFENFKPNETGTAGELVIKADSLKGAEYRFNITTNSTRKQEKEEQLESMDRLMKRISELTNVIQEDPRIEVNWGEILASYEELSDIKGAKKFITINNGPSPAELEMMQQMQQMEQQMQQMQQEAQQAVQMAQMSNLQPQTFAGGGQEFSHPALAQAAEQINNR